MKAFFVLVVALLAVFVSGTEAAPNEEHPGPVNVPEFPSGVQPRFTCDFLSGLGYNHSFCAAHCLMKGYKGGYCDSRGICNCRN